MGIFNKTKPGSDDAIIIELLAYNTPIEGLSPAIKLAKSVQLSSGWDVVKSAAFAARTAGVNVGEIGPGFTAPGHLERFGLNATSEEAILSMRKRGYICAEDLCQYSKQFPESAKVAFDVLGIKDTLKK